MKLREQLHRSFRSAVTTFEFWAQDVWGAPEETAHTDPSEWQMWDLWPSEPRRVACAALLALVQISRVAYPCTCSRCAE